MQPKIGLYGINDENGVTVGHTAITVKSNADGTYDLYVIHPDGSTNLEVGIQTATTLTERKFTATR